MNPRSRSLAQRRGSRHPPSSRSSTRSPTTVMFGTLIGHFSTETPTRARFCPISQLAFRGSAGIATAPSHRFTKPPQKCPARALEQDHVVSSDHRASHRRCYHRGSQPNFESHTATPLTAGGKPDRVFVFDAPMDASAQSLGAIYVPTCGQIAPKQQTVEDWSSPPNKCILPSDTLVLVPDHTQLLAEFSSPIGRVRARGAAPGLTLGFRTIPEHPLGFLTIPLIQRYGLVDSNLPCTPTLSSDDEVAILVLRCRQHLTTW